MMAMRAYMRSKTVDGVIDEGIAERVGLSSAVIEDMYKIMALADYEDRFVIPTTHREQVEDAYELRGECGFTDTNGCSPGISKGSLFGGKKRALKMPSEVQ
jgi:nitrate reductase beta subunit